MCHTELNLHNQKRHNNGGVVVLLVECRTWSCLGTIVQWPRASYLDLHLFASVSKQYNLVPVKEWVPCN